MKVDGEYYKEIIEGEQIRIDEDGQGSFFGGSDF